MRAGVEPAAVLLLALLPVLAALLGALLVLVRPPGAAMRSAIQHFAAGVVFSVVAVELLPDVVRVHDLVEIGWTFAAGVVLMQLAARSGSWLDARWGARVGQLVGVAVDVAIDGVLLGIAFAAGAKQGILLTAALALEMLSLAVALAAGLAGRGAGRARTVAVPSLIALLLPAGAWLGVTALRGVSEHTLAGVLAFGSAALLYLVTEELLAEAHETPETTLATSLFFVGFLLFLLLGML